jgi:AbrB family looped-hinge helix DNA binding protein
MTVVSVSSKGWIVIPAELRKKYDLRPGSGVALVDYGGVIAIVPALANPIEESAGLLKGGPPLGRALRQERQQERHRGR